MVEYIDKHQLLEDFKNNAPLTYSLIFDAIKSYPAMDIVQCKDCANFHKYGFKLEYTECKHFDCDVCEDGFCAWGERREEVEE